jgi:chromosome segregation ATPase
MLKSSILIILGMILGYGLFYSIFHLRCSDVLDDMEVTYNTTIANINEKYLKALEGHRLCMEEDDNQVQEVHELRGRLEAQSDLVASHRELLDKYQVSTGRLNGINSQIERKDAQLYVLKQQLDFHSKARAELQKELEQLKQSMAETLGQKTNEINSLRSSIEAFQSTETEMLEHVQHRYSAMCRQL